MQRSHLTVLVPAGAAILTASFTSAVPLVTTFDAAIDPSGFEVARINNKFNGNNEALDSAQLMIQRGALQTGGVFGTTPTSFDGRGLLRVDISDIPTDQTATAGTLRVVGVNNSFNAGSNFSIELHRLTTDWVAGTVGSPDGTTAVSWSDSDGTANPGDWVTDGGDFGSTPIDTFEIAQGFTSTSNLEIVFDLGSPEGLAALNSWIDDPSSNYGFLLRVVPEDDTVENSLRLFNYLNVVAPNRPILTVTTIPEPASLALLGAGAAVAFRRRR